MAGPPFPDGDHVRRVEGGASPGPTSHLVTAEFRNDGEQLRSVCSCGWEGEWRGATVFVRVEPETGHDLEAL